MAQDEGKQEEDKLEFTPQGETFGYISMDQARVLAMQTARQIPGEYGRRFAEILMAFDVVEENETEDYYEVTLSFRPQGAFTGTPGQEQFFIEKEGSVAHRQVLSLPVVARRRFPVIPAAFVLVVVLIVVGAAIYLGSGSEQNVDVPVAPFLPTEPPIAVAAPTPSAGALPTDVPAATTSSTHTPMLSPTATATLRPTPPIVPTSTPARTPTRIPESGAWPGAHGTMTISDGQDFDIGSGTLFWSHCCRQEGYFYSGSDVTDPVVTIANIVSPPSCQPNYSGYVGLTHVNDLSNAANLTYSVATPTIIFGTKQSICNMGLLVYKQGNQYGVIDFQDIDNASLNDLSIEYWVGDPGVTDFSGAPK